MNNYNDFAIIDVTKEELYKIMQEKFEAGYRLSQICSVAYPGYNEVTYSVNLDYLMENYKIKLPIDEEVKSFSDIFPAAGLYENEIKELWGVNVVGIALDYQNRFYRINEDTPYKKPFNVIEKKEGK